MGGYPTNSKYFHALGDEFSTNFSEIASHVIDVRKSLASFPHLLG
jgi:hypothetical protein